ncbi:MAG: glycosyltransferase family 2 protein [Candidatus Cryptobacteroides sp.]
MNKLVSFISVDFNGYAQTADMIRSIMLNVRSCRWEIIIVDNGSREDETRMIKKEFPQVITVRSNENLGFAGGNNLALEHAHGDYLFFINNDTEILQDNVHKLCKALEENPQAGMVCPKICFFSDKSVIQYAGYTPMRGIRMRNDMIGYGRKDDGSFDKPGFTAFPHGAAMMVRREALEDVGPMPEMYFLYYEELDWAMMFQRKGWKIYFEPSCTIYHKDSMTTKRHGPVFTYYMTRSRLIFAYRNLGGIQKWMSIMFTRYVASAKCLITNILHGRSESARAVFRANRDFRKMKREGRI